MDPGTGLAVAQAAFFVACVLVDSFGKSLKYFSDTEALVVALEIERLRLQTWGAHSGLADGKLAPHLTIASEILLRQLKIISGIFEDADKLRQRYGVEVSNIDESDPSPASRMSFVSRMRKSLRSSGVRLPGPAQDGGPESEAFDSKTQLANGASRDVSKRIRWVVRDREQMKQLVADLRAAVDILYKLLTESQMLRSAHDHQRINIVIVGSADEQSLAMVRAAVTMDGDKDAASMVDRKLLASIAEEKTPARAPSWPRKVMNLAQYDLPSSFADMPRFLARKREDPESLYLFEKKVFDPSIDHTSKTMLFSRIQRLIALLALPKASSFKVPEAEGQGYFHDPDNYCWWLIFRFPSPRDTRTITGSIPDRSMPVSLLHLLQSSHGPRPPLESRLALASDICTTFHHLYSSSWMHKSIRSDNILFPQYSEATASANYLSSSLVCGFEYSRLETESQTIDRSKENTNVSIAMYRHPDYQGEAAQGYQARYDFYSLGLVLLEIGLWAPLSSLFDSRPSKDPASRAVALPRDMQHFHRQEATILRDRVLYTVRKDLPFRMGSIYADVARWCLRCDSQTLDTNEFTPALAFYDNVVEPLAGLRATYSQDMVNI